MQIINGKVKCDGKLTIVKSGNSTIYTCISKYGSKSTVSMSDISGSSININSGNTYTDFDDDIDIDDDINININNKSADTGFINRILNTEISIIAGILIVMLIIGLVIAYFSFFIWLATLIFKSVSVPIAIILIILLFIVF